MKKEIPGTILLFFTIVLSGCSILNPSPKLGPAEVTEKFYRWYLGYPGNSLADRRYQESEYLSSELIDKVDLMLQADIPGRGDPFLLAQDIPEFYQVEGETILDDRAEVGVFFFWSGNPDPSQRTVELQLIQGDWKITSINFSD